MQSRSIRFLGLTLLVTAIGCHADPPAPQPTPTAAPEATPPKELEERIPAGAERMRVHWTLKLPSLAKCQGDYVFRDHETFAAFLSRASAPEPRPRPYEKWNSIDFSRQMAILVAEEHSSGGHDVALTAVWKCSTEIIVEILDRSAASGSAVTQAFEYPWDSAVVNRSDLPVRFLRRHQAG